MMSHLSPHPSTGKVYVMVIPHVPPFDEIFGSYAAMSAVAPWLDVATPSMAADLLTNHDIIDDPVFHFVLWGMMSLPLPMARKATITTVFFEAYGGDVLPGHVVHWEKFRVWAQACDWVYCHTPSMVDWLRGEGLVTELLPVGYHPSMGVPSSDLDRERSGFAYWGSHVGLRHDLVPAYKAQLGEDFKDLSGSYGALRRDLVEGSLAQLYLPHSKVWSGSTWRLWQAVATSVPLIAGASDLWPAIPGEHYLVPPSEDVEEVCAWLRSLRWEDDLKPVAERAHADLSGIHPLQHLTGEKK